MLMASITIRSLDETVKRKLRLRAALRNRSMEAGNLADAIRRGWNLSGALSCRCRRAARCASRPILHDRSRHKRLVGDLASDTVGLSAGMDALRAGLGVIHDGDYRGGAALRHRLAAPRQAAAVA